MTLPASVTQATEVVLPGRVAPAALQLRQRMLPAPGAGQALIRMEASGVSFAEQQMRRGRYPGQPAFPFVPGYDLVATVEAAGPGVLPDWVGARVAVVTKTGAWASHLIVPAADLLAVPADMDPALIETALVNGITAWQMLHRKARVRAGQTILVHGASGGVGTILVQLARHAGIRVIGTAAVAHHDALRALGVEPVDYRDPELAARLRALAPGGVDAVFDHLGLDSMRASFKLLAPGGALLAYGTAAALHEGGSVLRMFLGIVGQLLVWKALPNGHYASFYDFWGGRLLRPAWFRRRLREDLGKVLDLVSRDAIAPKIAARFSLHDAGAALQLAESRSVRGKVILVP